MRIVGILIVGASLALLSGCGHHFAKCSQSNKDYASARELPPLKAPPDLDAPDTRNGLKVPPLDTPERVRGREEACLDVPPPFSTPKSAEPKKPQ
jgi:uncharacterized lipoprotein